MKRIIAFILCVIIISGIMAGCKQTNKEFSVGYAKADITPQTSVPMPGFGDNDQRLSSTVMDPLYATCVACTDTKGNTVLMFGFDLLNTYGALCSDIATEISKEHGIPTENITFSASHTHSGSDQDPTKSSATAAVEKSNALIKEQCLKAAREALADRSPAKMYGSFARPENLNFMRHWVLDDGSYRGWRIWDYKGTLIGYPHKADNLMQLIKFSREEGKDIIMINWQAHYASADDINYTGISADYPGVLRNEMEAALDCHAAFFLGGSGNLVSNSRIPGEDTTKDYIEQGKALAKHAISAADNFVELELGDIQVSLQLYDFQNIQGPQLVVIGFGDFACAFAPFEIYDNNAKNVREASKYPYTFYASCANASYGTLYLPDHEGFRYPTYEALSHDDPPKKYTRFPEGSAEYVEETLIKMLDGIFSKSGMEVKERQDGYLKPEFIPVSDGVEYTNLTPGDITAYTEGTGDNGLYCLVLASGSTTKKMLANSKETAEAVLSRTTMKLLFDERNVIVGIAE